MTNPDEVEVHIPDGATEEEAEALREAAIQKHIDDALGGFPSLDGTISL